MPYDDNSQNIKVNEVNELESVNKEKVPANEIYPQDQISGQNLEVADDRNDIVTRKNRKLMLAVSVAFLLLAIFSVVFKYYF